LKCDPLGAPLPVEAFWAAAAAVTVIAAATAAARENLRRMRLPPSSRFTAGASGLARTVTASRFRPTIDPVARGAA
jgi:hypothetical protein